MKIDTHDKLEKLIANKLNIMPLIKKYDDSVLGEVKINFSVKYNRFEVICKRPNVYNKTAELNSWDDVETLLDELKRAFLEKENFIRKLIVVVFTSSEHNVKDDTKELFGMSSVERNNVSFTINFYVLNEYQIGKHFECRKLECHDGRDNPMEIREHELNLNILPQLLPSYKNEYVFDYTDELYDFLTNTTVQLKDIIKNMVKFMNPDPKVFLDNISKNQLELGE